MKELISQGLDGVFTIELKYYRKINGLTRRQLEIQANIPMNSIKKYEDKKCLIRNF